MEGATVSGLTWLLQRTAASERLRYPFVRRSAAAAEQQIVGRPKRTFMNRALKVVGTIYFSSLLLAGAAAITHRFVAAAVLATPALLLSFLAFAGHLVTLDDDYPGEWSNPENSRAIWRASLRQLGAKLAALVVAAVVFVAFSVGA